MTASTINTTTYNNIAANTVNNAVLDAAATLAWRQDIKAVTDNHASEINTILGKVINESGNNANGYYVKFEDGTLICTSTLITLVYAGSDLLQGTWTFPASYMDGSMAVTWSHVGDIIVGANAFHHQVTLGASSAVIGARGNGGTFVSGNTLTARCMSIGRWK